MGQGLSDGEGAGGDRAADIRADDSAALLRVGEENARARRFYEREGWTQSTQTRTSVLGPSEVQYRLDLTS